MPHRKVSVRLDVTPGPTDHVRKAFEQIQRDMARSGRINVAPGAGKHGPSAGPFEAGQSPMTEMGRALERLASGPMHVVADGLNTLASSIDELADSLGAGGLLFTGIRYITRELPAAGAELYALADAASGFTKSGVGSRITGPGTPPGLRMDPQDTTPIGGGPLAGVNIFRTATFPGKDFSPLAAPGRGDGGERFAPGANAARLAIHSITEAGSGDSMWSSLAPLMNRLLEPPRIDDLVYRKRIDLGDDGPGFGGTWGVPRRAFYRSMFPDASPPSRGNPDQLRLSALTDNTKALNEVTGAVRDLVFEMRGGLWQSLANGRTGDEAFFPKPRHTDGVTHRALYSGLDNNYWGSSLGLSGNH